MKHIVYIVFAVFMVNYTIAQTEIASGGTGGAYTLAMPANVDALTPGLSFTFKANHASVNPSSLSVNGLAAVSITKSVGVNLDANDIVVGQIVTVVFDGTNFQMITASGNLAGGGTSSLIEDADGDTEINVEAAGDQDVIHFSLGDNAGYPGAEYFTMIGPRLDVINTGGSLFMGENSGQNSAIGAGSYNTFIGGITGSNNTSGTWNTAVGGQSFQSNVVGFNNAAFGRRALRASTGNNNTSIGTQAFENLTTGNENTALGKSSGTIVTTGDKNTFVGNASNASSGALVNSTAIGANSEVSTSNSLVLGSINGVNGATAGTNVGIGTTSPTALLTLEGDNDDVHHTSNSTAGSGSADYNFRRNNGGGTVANGNRLGALRFYGQEPGGAYKLSSMIHSSVDANPAANDVPGNIIFSTQEAGNTGNPTEKVRISSDGDVGIGTNNPAATLDITGTDAIVLPQGNTGQRPGTPEAGMLRFNADLTTFEGYDGASWNDLMSGGAGDFFADGTVAMSGQFRSISGSAAAPGISFSGDSDNGIYRPAANSVAITTAGTERLIINAAGNVGLGVASPNNALEVSGASIFRFEAGGISRPGVTHFSIAHTASMNYLESAAGSTPEEVTLQAESFNFTTGTSSLGEHGSNLYIQEGGNVGIGTTGPSEELEVAGDISIVDDNNRLMRKDNGNEDYLPVAYGVINDGSIESSASTSNFTVFKAGAGRYQVTYVGSRTFSGFGEFQLSLTPYYQGTTLVANYQYLGGKSFEIFLTDLTDTLMDGVVSFTLRLK